MVLIAFYILLWFHEFHLVFYGCPVFRWFSCCFHMVLVFSQSFPMCSLGFPSVFGFHIVSLCVFLFGFSRVPMIFRFSYDFSVLLMCSYGLLVFRFSCVPIVLLLLSYGFPAVFFWFYAFPKVLLWFWNFPTAFLCFSSFLVVFVVFLWFSSFPLVFLRFSSGFPLVLCCVSMVFWYS